MPHRSAGIVVGKAQKMQLLNSIPVCHMNKNFNQTAGQVAPIKVTRPVLLRQLTLPWRPIT